MIYLSTSTKEYFDDHRRASKQNHALQNRQGTEPYLSCCIQVEKERQDPQVASF